MRNRPASGRMHKPILIMAGGTGGHIYPALAVARHLRKLNVPLLWLGSRRGLENRIIPPTGISLLTIAVSGLRGRGTMAILLAPIKLLYALIQAALIMLRARPAAVLGMGGFASGPGGLAAWLLRIPLLIHEQNAIAGYTNRLLAPLAARLMEAFPGAFGRKNAVYTGNPVRSEIAAIATPAARARKDNVLRLLVLGGSQGARALNQCVPAAIATFNSRKISTPPFNRIGGDLRLEVWHQSGAEKLPETLAAYRAASVDARIDEYIECMDEAYAWADIVVCRAGAMTIAELSTAGLASILVPFPQAVDDHQTANAHFLANAGAAILVPESELTPYRLAAVIAEFAGDPERIVRMASAARAMGRPHATEEVAAICMEVAYA